MLCVGRTCLASALAFVFCQGVCLRFVHQGGGFVPLTGFIAFCSVGNLGSRNFAFILDGSARHLHLGRGSRNCGNFFRSYILRQTRRRQRRNIHTCLGSGFRLFLPCGLFRCFLPRDFHHRAEIPVHGVVDRGFVGNFFRGFSLLLGEANPALPSILLASRAATASTGLFRRRNRPRQTPRLRGFSARHHLVFQLR